MEQSHAVTPARLLRALAGRPPAEQGWTPESRQLFDLAQAHGLLPQLCRSAPGWMQTLPPGELDRAKQQHAHRCLRLTAELHQILDLFDQHDIQAITFKGPVLAVQLYGDPAGRGYRDIDVLVREEDSDRAFALLVAQGYEPPHELRGFPFRWWRRWGDECRFTRDGIRVELHWALDQRGFLSVDLDGAWSGLEPVQVGVAGVRTFSRAELVLYLAAHGAKHGWERLEWILDFSQLVRTSPALDWLRIADTARRRGAERALLLGLRLARDLLMVTPPVCLAIRVAEDRRVRTLANDVCASLRGEQSLRQRPWTLLAFHLRVQERVRDRVRYLTNLVFTSGPGDWALIPLPGWLSWLYVLVRPLRLLVLAR